MTFHYELTSAPVAISLGSRGRALVRSTVPFEVDHALHCSDQNHLVDIGSPMAVFRALGKHADGVIRVKRLTN